MEYKGKLFGKIGRSYIPLLNTTEDYEALEENVKQLKLKLSIAENALSAILNLDDYDETPNIANSALEKLAKIDGF